MGTVMGMVMGDTVGHRVSHDRKAACSSESSNSRVSAGNAGDASAAKG
jgi:hypothetical protein